MIQYLPIYVEARLTIDKVEKELRKLLEFQIQTANKKFGRRKPYENQNKYDQLWNNQVMRSIPRLFGREKMDADAWDTLRKIEEERQPKWNEEIKGIHVEYERKKSWVEKFRDKPEGHSRSEREP